MAKFAVGKPITTQESAIAVDPGLPAGVHRFQLVVVNAAGVKSAPDEVLVQVQSRTILIDPRITPVISPVVTPVVTPVVRPIVNPLVTPVPVRPVQSPKKGKPS